jgi:hypothetical protein
MTDSPPVRGYRLWPRPVEKMRRIRDVLLAIVFLSIVIPFGFVLSVRPTWVYITGASATATPARCWSVSGGKGEPRIHCSGKWVFSHGAQGSGEIEGATRDDIGKPLKVRADRKYAVKWRFRYLLEPVIPPIFAAIVIGVLRSEWRESRGPYRRSKQ